jgi:hypothetical protein
VNNSAEFLFRNRSEIEETFEIFDSSWRYTAIYDSSDEKLKEENQEILMHDWLPSEEEIINEEYSSDEEKIYEQLTDFYD